MANEKNLKPFKKGQVSHDEAVKRGSKGGKESVKARAKKKELIQISMFLHNFIDSKQGDVKKGLEKIVQNGGRDLLSLIKEAREATEGNKSILMNPDGSELLSKGINVSFEEPKE